MGKKKPFIDKKNASVYHVVRRSQRDVGTEATAETLSDFVLMPSPANATNYHHATTTTTNTNNNKNVTSPPSSSSSSSMPPKHKIIDFQTLKSQIAAAGLLDETAKTYSQYTKPIERSDDRGTYIPSNILHASDASNLDVLFTDTTKNNLDYALQEAMAVHEVGRMLDSIALTADCMEEDIAQALFDFEEGQFEEILDDFCLTANKEELEECHDGVGTSTDASTAAGGGGEFNFEQHIKMLMEKARAQESGRDAVGGRTLEDDFFQGVTPLHGRIDEEEDDNDDDDPEFDYDQYGEHEEESEEDDYDEYDDEDGESLDRQYSGKNNDEEQQRVLCQKFEEALLEYDSDDVGNLDEECDDIVGDRPLEGDVHLEAVLDEFLTEKEDEILIEGTRRNHVRAGGSGYSALVGKKMVNADDLNKLDGANNDSLLVNIEESKKQMARDLADADAILANPEMDLPPEEILIDGKSYFTATSRSMWDCESILSTYSNLDNNPVVIGRSKKKKKSKKMNENNGNTNVIPEEGPVKIHLSNKTGLPLGVFGTNNNQSPEDDIDDFDGGDTFVSINRGEARRKDESKTDKKVRKFSVKEDRKICRMQKKIMKEAFKEEFQKRGHEAVVDSLGGSTVFRIP